jgi:hypothetical protein
VSVLEIGLAVLCALGGVRSLWVWSRHPFESRDPVDHLLFAAFVTGRVGLWSSIAGWFVLYGYLTESGGSVARFRWYLAVPLVLGGVQLLAGYFLGRRGEHPSAAGRDRTSSDGDAPPPGGDEVSPRP